MLKQVIIYLVLFVAICSSAQTDTIVLKSKLSIPCHILKVGHAAIEFTDLAGHERFIDIYTVNYYFKDGQKHEGKTRVGISAERSGDTVNVSDEIAYMRFCMNKFHNQYTTGLTVTLIGGALAGTSLFLSNDVQLKQEVSIGGVVMTLVGLGISMDAHKWFAKAAWGVSGKGNRMQVVYRFK